MTSEGFLLPEGTPVNSVYIALQAESHPFEFRKVELLDLSISGLATYGTEQGLSGYYVSNQSLEYCNWGGKPRNPAVSPVSIDPMRPCSCQIDDWSSTPGNLKAACSADNLISGADSPDKDMVFTLAG